MESLKKFFNFVQEINENNSRNYKIDVLKKYENDEDIKFYLEYLFNSYKVTGISEKKFNKQVDRIAMKQFDSVKELLNYLVENNTGTDDIICMIHNFMDKNKEICESPLFESLITKNLQLGMDAKTINKIMPNLIPTFDVQLANKYFDNPEIVNGKEFTLTTKIDGGRILTVKKNGEVKFYTRAGQEYEGLVDIKNELENLEYDNFVLDGEITLLDKGNLISKDQYKQTMKITRKDGDKHGVKILAFDVITPEQFENQSETLPYKERRKQLESHFGGLTFVNILPVLYSGKDTTKIIPILEEQTQNGEEGIMINFNDEPYAFTRSNSLIKVKKMQDVDLPIVDFEEGTNKLAGTLGAFFVEYKGNRVKVGSGISDEIRKEVWNNKERYLGVTIEIQYFEETENDKGVPSLRFPIFKDFRFDK